MKQFSNLYFIQFWVFNFPMRIDFYPKLRLNFVFWDLNFISLFVNRMFIGQISPWDDFIAIPTYFRPIIYSVEVWHESNVIILLMFAWLNISEHPILWHLHPFVLIMYSIECCLFPFQFFLPWIIPLFFQRTSSISIICRPGGRPLPERGWVSPSAMLPVIIVFI